jgi:hypothetical protein
MPSSINDKSRYSLVIQKCCGEFPNVEKLDIGYMQACSFCNDYMEVFYQKYEIPSD